MVTAEDTTIGQRHLAAGPGPDGNPPELLFCENETNTTRLYGVAGSTPYPKDGINDHVVSGRPTVNPDRRGTKVACRYRLRVGAGEAVELRLRLYREDARQAVDLERDYSWAALAIFRIDGGTDFEFLGHIFHKLLINFTWWVNRKDALGDNVFQGGFLGLDNIGPLDRSAPLPGGGLLEQSDGTAWMARYCLNMLEMALRLANRDRTYEDVAVKFFEHFAAIAVALGALWDETDGFSYDRLRRPDGTVTTVRSRSMAGLLPIFAAVQLASSYEGKITACAWGRNEWPERRHGALMTRILALLPWR